MLGCLSVVSANPFNPGWFEPTSPVTDKPNVALFSTGLLAFPPLDNQSIWISFIVSLPTTWMVPAGSGWLFVGWVSSVGCWIDNSTVLFDNTTIAKALGNVDGYGYTIWGLDQEIPLNYNFSQTIAPLPIGQHTLTITVKAVTFYQYNTEGYDVSTSVQYNFTVVSSINT